MYSMAVISKRSYTSESSGAHSKYTDSQVPLQRLELSGLEQGLGMWILTSSQSNLEA